MIWIVLPAYNEAENLGDLLREITFVALKGLPQYGVTVLVVDDGSTDGTPEVVRQTRDALATTLASRCAIELISLDGNRGLAEAIRTGLLAASSRSAPRDIVLTMDADNSHVPGLIASLVRVINEGYDVVIASRYVPGARVVGLTRHRRMLSLGASLLFQALLPIPGVRDYTCGFRAYRAPLLKAVLAENPQFISERGFTCMVDILLKLRTRRPAVAMTEVPLLLRYDLKKGASKMNVAATTHDTLRLLVRRRLGIDP